MSAITTHVLDLALGRAAAGVPVELEVCVGASWRPVGRGITDADGRLRTLTSGEQPLTPGGYRLSFDTGTYFERTGTAAFYPRVTVEFTVSDAAGHYHVPLLISPFGYTTYRGT